MRLHRLFILFILLSWNTVISQVENIIITKNEEDIRLQLEALDESKIDEILSLSNILYKIAFDNEDPKGMIDALEHLSIANLNSGNNNLAIEYLDNASSIAAQNKMFREQVQIINLKGNHYFDIEEYDKSSSAYSEALSMAEEINNPSFMSVIKTNIAFIKLRTGNYKAALNELKDSEKELLTNPYERSEERVNIGIMLFNARISEAYIQLNKLDSALYANNKGLSYTKKIKIDNVHIDLLMHRGIIYKNKKDHTNALKFLNQAKDLCYKANDIIFLGKILNLQAECKIDLKEYKGSIDVLLESEEILTQKYSNSDEISRCYKLLGQAYKMDGDLKKSNSYYEKHILSLSKLNSKKSLASRKVQDIAMNDFQNEIDNLENQKKKQKNKLTYSQIGLVIVVLGLILVILFFQKTKKKNKEKFEALLVEIEKKENANTSEITVNDLAINDPIIDTKDKTLESRSTELDISDDLYEQILTGLKKIESQEYYLKTDCNLYNVAKKINTNTSYLSKVINSHFNKNFNTYINDLRINYAIVRLKNDSKFRSYSIKSIAKDVGYKSADSFSKYFKIHTGLLPSFYVKQLNSKN
ncbi:AraC-type DNA-binding protein [Aquimarina amphilecti]|uniref:AraC-type DNA-binding protein n=1 Tax=Aquimarina amphilecti TaxID=1038014 RepID=A0A1H7VGB1_AQUAM|nr:helix-turn-helix domain-containing protein [Aquimarina amphilecti]SEM07925.1 AraC-type DNA-binding protein [Aquimarina amphilecti]